MKKKVLFSIYLLLFLNFCYGKSITRSFSKKDSTYIIESKIDLKGKTLKIPKNCRLIFTEKGSIENGTIYFNETFLEGSPRFVSINPKGKISCKIIKLSWFDFTEDAEFENQTAKNSSLFNMLFDTINGTVICDSFLPVKEAIKIRNNISLKSKDWQEQELKESYDYSYIPTSGFYCINKTNLFEICENGSVNLFGIRLQGKNSVYENLQNKTCGIYAGIQEKTNFRSQIGLIYNSSIQDFYYGIEVTGTYLERIQNSSFSDCTCGLYSIWTSDFDIFGCRFYNCGNSCETASIFLAASNMININSNYFESNFTDILLADGDTIINIQNNLFKNTINCDISIIPVQDRPLSIVSKEDLFPTAMDCIVITDNQCSMEKHGLSK